jgi:phage protein D
MNKVARSRTFEHMTRADVMRKLAQDSGYGPARQDIEDTEHGLPVITQARMTDA